MDTTRKQVDAVLCRVQLVESKERCQGQGREALQFDDVPWRLRAFWRFQLPIIVTLVHELRSREVMGVRGCIISEISFP